MTLNSGSLTFGLDTIQGLSSKLRALRSLNGWLAIGKPKPLSLFVSLLLMLKKAFDNGKIEKQKVKVVLA